MIHIKDKLMQYEDEYLKYSKYDGLYVADVLEMLEQLKDDLEQDESYPEDVTYETVEWNVAGWVAHETGSADREYLDEFDFEHFEVAGNIFDNLELLQEGYK